MSIRRNKMDLIFSFEDVSGEMYLIRPRTITDTYDSVISSDYGNRIFYKP